MCRTLGACLEIRGVGCPPRRVIWVLQVFTKYCLFTALDMTTVNAKAVAAAVDRSRQRLGVDSIDLLQLYWGDYNIPR